MTDYPTAPEWQVSQWLNSDPLTLADLRGRVVVAHAFQMLCRGCVMQALPQMQRVHDTFRNEQLAVIGLHTVFEHREEQNPRALRAFLGENRYTFPVGVDKLPDKGLLPQTMRTYGMEGTPTLLLIDARGHLREHHFGHIDDLILGTAIGKLLTELARNPAP